MVYSIYTFRNSIVYNNYQIYLIYLNKSEGKKKNISTLIYNLIRMKVLKVALSILYDCSQKSYLSQLCIFTFLNSLLLLSFISQPISTFLARTGKSLCLVKSKGFCRPALMLFHSTPLLIRTYFWHSRDFQVH